jgi:uncharacterized protein YndB with AHSA1/START domain
VDEASERIRYARVLMLRVEETVTVASTVPEVFAWIRDPDLARQWQPGVLDHRIIHEEPGVVGTEFVEIMETSEGPVEMHGRVVAFEPDRTLAIAMVGQRTTVGTRYDLDAVPAGTAVRTVVELDLPGTLAAVVQPLIKRRVRRQTQRQLALLRDLCEDSHG